MVQKNIGAANALSFDMNAVCSGFVYAVETADNFIKSGKYRRILVIGADCYSKILDMQDKTTSPLFGDGAGALILEASTEPLGILTTHIESDGSRWELIQVPSSGTRKPITPESIALKENTFKMAGRSVYTLLPMLFPTNCQGDRKAGISPAELVYHSTQANAESLCDHEPGSAERYFSIDTTAIPPRLRRACLDRIFSGVIKKSRNDRGFGGGVVGRMLLRSDGYAVIRTRLAMSGESWAQDAALPWTGRREWCRPGR
jgi:hypothetical protein